MYLHAQTSSAAYYLCLGPHTYQHTWQYFKKEKTDQPVSHPIQQGLSWLTRKAIGLATVTLEVNEYKDDDEVVHIDIAQTLTGGVQGTTERRITNWTENDHTDHIFGHVKGMSRLFGGAEKAGKVRPDVDIQSRVGDEKEDEEVARFLRGEVLVDGEESEGWEVDEAGKWLQSWVTSVNDGWTAEQVKVPPFTISALFFFLFFPPF